MLNCLHCDQPIVYRDWDGTYRDETGAEVCETGWPAGYPRLHEPA